MANFVQGCNGQNLNGTSASAIFGSNNAAGNLIAVSVLWFSRVGSGAGYPGLSVADTRGNTYQSALVETYLGGGVTLGTYYVLSSASGANTVTATSSTTGALFISAHEVAPTASKVWKFGQANFGTATAIHQIVIGNTSNGGYSGDVYSFASMGIDSDYQQPTPFNTSAIWSPRQYNFNPTGIDSGSTTTGGAEFFLYGSLATFDALNAGSLSFSWLQTGKPVNTAIGILSNFTCTDAVCTAPTASPAAGTYTGTQSVTLTQAEGKDMYYTTDGSTPSTSSTHYIGTISISATTQLNVLAHDAASVLGDSAARFLFTIQPTPPANSNINITWERRTRVGGAWISGTGTVPLSEESELYELFIMDPTGAAIVRHVQGLTTNSFMYTAAMQYNDFNAYVTSCFVKVYQVSAAVGLGYPAINATLGLSGSEPDGGSNATQILGSNITGSATDGDVIRYNSSTGNWEITGPLLKRQNLMKTTASLANNAAETGSMSIACGTFALLKVAVDRNCRVQFYSTAAFRDADSRAYDVLPSTGTETGIIADFGFDTGGSQSWTCSPALIGANADASPLNTIYYRVTNLSGSTSTVAVTITIVPLEIV